jgi:hypothetical protein
MKSIAIRTCDGVVRVFEGDARLHTFNIGADIHFVSMPDQSSPSGRCVVWQQRVEHGVAEGFELTASE